MTKFVLLGEARSGTTWLGDLIRRHPQAACLMEPLHERYESRLDYHRFCWPNSNDVWRVKGKGTCEGIWRYFNKYVWTLPAEAAGAKLLSYYFSRYPPLSKYLRNVENLQVVWIERNPLRAALSFWYATELRNWNEEHRNNIKKRAPIHLSPQYLWARLAESDRNRKLMYEAVRGRDSCLIHYCDLLKDVKTSMDKVSRFLGVAPLDEYTTIFHKMTPRPFKELVLNWKALQRATPAKWQKHWDRDKS